MFWRRSKLRDEDEPLVPHGLIWQATGDETPAEPPLLMQDSSPKEVSQAPAESVRMPVRSAHPPRRAEEPPSFTPEQGKISPPLSWPRVDGAEVARRAQLKDTAVSFPYRKPVISAAIPKPVDSELEPEVVPRPPILVPLPPKNPARAAGWMNVRNVFSGIHRVHMPDVLPLIAKLRLSQSLASLKDGISTRTHAFGSRLSALRMNSGPTFAGAKLKLMSSSKAALDQSRSGVQSFGKRLKAVDLGGPARIAQRIRTAKVTVRIPQGNSRAAVSFMQQMRASRARIQQLLHRDERLWTSMGMAALSALLALSVISASRHYRGSTAAASSIATPSSNVENVRSVPPPVVIPAKVSAISAPAQKPNPAVTELGTRKSAAVSPDGKREEAAAARAVPTSRENVPKRRVRRSAEDDDYVAKDTYVYYGASRSPSR